MVVLGGGGGSYERATIVRRDFRWLSHGPPKIRYLIDGNPPKPLQYCLPWGLWMVHVQGYLAH